MASDRDPRLLDKVGDEKRSAVEEEVHLPVVVKVDRRRAVLDVLENGVAQPLAQRDGQPQAVPRCGLEQKIVP